MRMHCTSMLLRYAGQLHQPLNTPPPSSQLAARSSTFGGCLFRTNLLPRHPSERVQSPQKLRLPRLWSPPERFLKNDALRAPISMGPHSATRPLRACVFLRVHLFADPAVARAGCANGFTVRRRSRTPGKSAQSRGAAEKRIARLHQRRSEAIANSHPTRSLSRRGPQK
jgi:hypothetical protein